MLASKKTTREALTEKDPPLQSAIEGFGDDEESCRCRRGYGQCGLHWKITAERRGDEGLVGWCRGENRGIRGEGREKGGKGCELQKREGRGECAEELGRESVRGARGGRRRSFFFFNF